MYPLSVVRCYFTAITLSLFLLGCQSQPNTTTKVKVTTKPLSTSSSKAIEKSDANSKNAKPKAIEPSRKSNTKAEAKSDVPVDTSPSNTVIPPNVKAVETIAPPVITNPPVRKRLPSQLIFEDLISRADQARKQKQWPQAATLYQQAQRLKPKRTVSYARLSEVLLAQNTPTDAENFARQGLKVAKSRSQKRGFWALIALSLEKQGKSAEAAQARAELAKLR